MSNVFIIVNEWTDVVGNTSSTVVDGRYFESESEAWEALREIALAYDTDLLADDTSLQFADHKAHLSYEEFYIQELVKL